MGRSVIGKICVVAALVGFMLFLVGIASLWSEPGEIMAGSSDQTMTKEVVIRRGDTLWSLAQIHGPSDRDVRETVHRIRVINGLESALLQPGVTLLVPLT